MDARSDIFSFGSMLYEMVTGLRPFHGDTAMSTNSAMNLFLLPLEPPGAGGGLPQPAGPPRQVTHGRAQWHVHRGVWSPDGSTLIYTRDADQGDIYMTESYR